MEAAFDGRTALTRLQTNDYYVMLLELRMGSMDGMEVYALSLPSWRGRAARVAAVARAPVVANVSTDQGKSWTKAGLGPVQPFDGTPDAECC